MSINQTATRGQSESGEFFEASALFPSDQSPAGKHISVIQQPMSISESDVRDGLVRSSSVIRRNAPGSDAPGFDAPGSDARASRPLDDDECVYCIDEMCSDIGGGDSLCKDQTVLWFTRETLFNAFSPPAKDFSDFERKIRAESSARKVGIISDYGTALTAYLQTQTVQQNAQLKVGLSRFIAKLLDVVEKERKHGCAGDNCSEPVDSDSFVTFDDIAGAQMEKQEIMNGFIYPMTYPSLFPTVSKGILFYGPPGTGKTLLAKATAHYMTNAAFYAPTPSDFKGGIIGESEAKVRNVFECACQRVSEDLIRDPKTGKLRQRYQQAIIFIDEFESIASDRESGNSGTTSSALTVPTLLQLLEGVESKKLESVSLMAATNLPWTIDPAILRRIPAKIFVDLPTRIAREFVIRKTLNDAFSKFLSVKDFRMLGKNRSKGLMLNKSGDPVPYIRRNFKVTAQNMTTGGGIYQNVLQAANPNFSLDAFVDQLVKLTGPKPSASKYRRFYHNGNGNYDNEYSEGAFSKYGFSLSDLEKALDGMIADMGSQALAIGRVSDWDEYSSQTQLDSSDVPRFLHQGFFFASPQGSRSLKNLSASEKQRVISWNIDEGRALAIVQKRGSSIVESKYEDVVRYYLTGLSPSDEPRDE